MAHEQGQNGQHHPPENPYLSSIARIESIRDETLDVRTLRLALQSASGRSALPTDKNGTQAPAFDWRAGQFAIFSIFGAGECVFTLANSPTRKSGNNGDHGAIECTFRAVGKVTSALRELGTGQHVGLRGPYGNWFDVEAWKGRHIAIVGGGIGMAAVRSPLQHVLDNRDDYGDVLVLNGARTVADLVYEHEVEEWKSRRVEVVRTVDPGGETPDWTGKVGLIPHIFEQLGLTPENRTVVACGPPIMLKYLFASLQKLGYAPENVVTTLENRMKCGIGHCGRCNVGRTYLCTRGPVFTWAELQSMPDDM
jgi:sulfhydrogenase subunit gamma (sulfur reductase)